MISVTYYFRKCKNLIWKKDNGPWYEDGIKAIESQMYRTVTREGFGYHYPLELGNRDNEVYKYGSYVKFISKEDRCPIFFWRFMCKVWLKFYILRRGFLSYGTFLCTVRYFSRKHFSTMCLDKKGNLVFRYFFVFRSLKIIK